MHGTGHSWSWPNETVTHVKGATVKVMRRKRLAARVVALVTAAAVAATAVAAAAAGAPAGSGERIKLRLGLASSPVPALPNSVNWLAKDLGFYEAEGLDVDVVEMRGTPTVIRAMRAGEIDVGNVNTEDVLRLTASGQLQLWAIHSPDDRFFFVIGARETVRTVTDLRGKSFGINRIGSLDHVLTALVLKANGLNPDTDVRWVAVGSPSVRAQALAAGRIDATTTSIATWQAIAREPGVHILVDVDAFHAVAPIVQKVNAVTDQVLREKPEALRRFTMAILKAARYFATHRDAWVEALLKQRPELSRDDLQQLWETFETSWAVNGLMNLEHYGRTAAFLYERPDFADVPKVPVRRWADTHILDAALKAIGVYPGFDAPGRPIPGGGGSSGS